MVEADNENAYFPNPMTSSEVRATSKSISKWTWKYRHELTVGGGGIYAERAKACQKKGS